MASSRATVSYLHERRGGDFGGVHCERRTKTAPVVHLARLVSAASLAAAAAPCALVSYDAQLPRLDQPQ
ncbi:hypothetical protein F2P81_019054 [Scophthalmus maximus]|uniref:Uncharacterized protein n=1 Tax=Scophthalmus maximus TaxID=52904 RepID=A0A6A4SBD0_SCOMX|nr:hypothetical protein F2P81_019054 [Scophthalmus maximus]